MSTEPMETARQGKEKVVRPLRKKTLGGALYVRDSKIEAKLNDLLALSPDELVARCVVEDRNDPAYVPSECLLYVVRTFEADAVQHFKTVFDVLMQRVLRKLPTGESADGKRLFLPQSRVREDLFDRFTALLARDRTTYAEELDYFEVRFDGALASLRHDVQRKACRQPSQVSIEIDPGTGDLAREVEAAAGSFDPFDPAEMARADYRSRLKEAIKSLPAEQRTIVEMIGRNIPIDSKIAGAVTIAKSLGKSEKTIRSHRDQAFSALKAMLKKGEMI